MSDDVLLTDPFFPILVIATRARLYGRLGEIESEWAGTARPLTTAHIRSFVQPFGSRPWRRRECILEGWGLRLADNLDLLPPRTDLLAAALRGFNAGAAGGDPWWEPRKMLGDDALIQWRIGPGRDTDELIEACDCFPDYRMEPDVEARLAREWSTRLPRAVPGFPRAAVADQGLILSEDFDPLPAFGQFRVLTIGGLDEDGWPSLDAGPPLREVLAGGNVVAGFAWYA